jgi:hypothetical protein
MIDAATLRELAALLAGGALGALLLGAFRASRAR